MEGHANRQDLNQGQATVSHPGMLSPAAGWVVKDELGGQIRKVYLVCVVL